MAVDLVVGYAVRLPIRVAAAWVGLVALTGAGGARELALKEGQEVARPLAVLFQGRQVTVHHSPAGFLNLVRMPFAERGVRFDFTESLADLNTANLARYDALFVYGNAFYLLSADQEAAMRSYVEAGGGLAAMHVACWSSPFSPAWTALVGGGFLGHYAIQEFTPQFTGVNHPIVQGLGTYTSEDEPYQFRDLAADRTVLSYRTGPGPEEPVSWVRYQGTGKVFYEAGGHDIRTWSQPNFQEMTIRGIKWAAKAPGSDTVSGITRAWVSEGGAVGALVELDVGGEVRQALAAGGLGGWMRPVLVGDKVYDRNGILHSGILADSVRVGGTRAAPVVALAGGSAAGGIEGKGIWTGKSGAVATGIREGDWLEWGGGNWELTAPGAESIQGMVMDQTGRWACQAVLRSADMLEEKSVLLRGERGGAPLVALGEGDIVSDAGGSWTAGAPVALGLSMGNTGRMAAVVAEGSGRRLVVSGTGGWETLLSTGAAVPGLAGQVVAGLCDVRLNDNGGMVVRGSIQGADGTVDVVWHRSAGGAWREVVRDGGQSWLALGEMAITQGAGTGAWLDASGGVWLLGQVSGPGGVSKVLAWAAPGGTLHLRCREGEVRSFGRQSATVVSLGMPADWSFGPPGMSLGAVTVVEGSGAERQWLVRWLGGHALAICKSGAPFTVGPETIEAQSFRISGGGTGQDGHGGAINSEGKWAAVVTTAQNEDLLVTGSDLRDSDGDGREDLLEDALGTDPLIADTADSLVAVKSVAGESCLVFQRDPSGGFTYHVEVSHDLVAWTASSAMPRVAADQTGVAQGFERVEVVIEGERAFARVKVEHE